MDNSSSVYAVTCLYGLERLLAGEVRRRLDVTCERHWCEVIFSFGGLAGRLRELRIGNNVFLDFGTFSMGPARNDLRELAERIRQLPIELWLARWVEFNGGPPDTNDICITVSRKGQHQFTYREVQDIALAALNGVTSHNLTLDPGPLELRVVLEEGRCFLRGRLSATPLSRRPYKAKHWPSETDPTLAAAMVEYSRPTSGDRFLDPFCGTGTVAIERAAYGPASLIVAGDLKAKMVEFAGTNARAAGANISFSQWDARQLPFADGSFTRIVTNPPQSNPRDGAPWSPAELAELLADCLRVLAPQGLMVLLARPELPLARALALTNAARIAGRLQCEWKGKPCALVRVAKAAVPISTPAPDEIQ